VTIVHGSVWKPQALKAEAGPVGVALRVDLHVDEDRRLRVGGLGGDQGLVDDRAAHAAGAQQRGGEHRHGGPAAGQRTVERDGVQRARRRAGAHPLAGGGAGRDRAGDPSGLGADRGDEVLVDGDGAGGGLAPLAAGRDGDQLPVAGRSQLDGGGVEAMQVGAG
jgi:hypothetical protein